MDKISIPLSIIIGFCILGGTYYFVEFKKEETTTKNIQQENAYKTTMLETQIQIQTEIDLIRKAVAPTKTEIVENNKNLISATEMTQDAYQEILDARQKKVDEINNTLFQLHQ